MFKNTFQSGFLSILYSIGSKPLQIWDKQGKPGMQQRAIGRLTGPTLTCLFPGLNAAFGAARPGQRVCEACGVPLPMAELSDLSLAAPVRILSCASSTVAMPAQAAGGVTQSLTCHALPACPGHMSMHYSA